MTLAFHLPAVQRAIRVLLALCLYAILSLAHWSAQAQTSAAATPANAANTANTPAPPPAQLTVFNRPVMLFRASSLGLPPEARQRRAAEQIRQTLSHVGDSTEISLQAGTEGMAVLLNGNFAFWVLPGDVDGEGAQALNAAAEQAAKQLRQALAERREARDWRELGTQAGAVLASLLLLLPLLWSARIVHRALLGVLTRLALKQSRRLRLGGVTLLSGDRLLDALRSLLRLAYAAVLLLLMVQWLGWALRQFPFTRPWGERLQQAMLDLLLQFATALAQALPNVFVAAVIFLLAHFLLAGIKPIFDRAEHGAVDLGWLDADTARPTRRLITIGVWAFALVMAYPYLPGAQTEAFKGLSVLLGLMVSLGASSVVGQAAAGLILMYTRTLRVGEFVRIGEHEGTVTELGSFATRIRTGQGEELSVPNSLITGAVTRNYSRAVKGEGFVIDTTVTIGYDTPWRQVEAMLKLAASRTPGVLHDPPPRVFQTALNDFYVAYRLVAQAQPQEPGPRAQVLSLLHGQIQDTFNEFGVQIMSPNYFEDPAEPKLVPRSRWYESPARPTEEPHTQAP